MIMNASVEGPLELVRQDLSLPVDTIVGRCRDIDIGRHPVLVRLASDPVDMSTVYLLMANLQAGISRHFVRWLAGTIERLDDRRAASLLARQLDDELGSGDFTQIHSVLLERFVSALSDWRPAGDDEVLLRGGRRLAKEGGEPFRAEDVHEALGALIVGEIFAEKMDACLARAMRRQNAVTGEALHWLNVHEALEVNHAEDSGALALFVPKHGPELAAAWRGAITQWNTLWRFLDDVEVIRQRTIDSARARPL